MRCKKHLQLQDLTSTIGVCASCLRERLQPLLAAQAQAQSEGFSNSYTDHNHSRRKPKAEPKENPPPANAEENPPPAKPEENPPYVTQRKSDCEPRRERLFFSTPEVSAAACDGRATSEKRRHGGRFWILSNIFRGRSNKTQSSLHEDPCNPPPSGLATILPVHRHARYRSTGQGLSPLTAAENLGEFSAEVDTAEQDRSDSGNSSKSSPSKQNSTPAMTHRRSSIKTAAEKGLTSIVFCLTPLVRASPNRHWSHKGMGHEMGAGGVYHISNAPSFYTNRSRKLADFGKGAHNR